MYKTLILVFILISSTCYALDFSSDLIEKADSLYNKGKEEDAKYIYIEAAEKGNPLANYALAYKYGIEAKKNYRIAAISGHPDGVRYYLDEVFFRAGTIEDSDPEDALEVYYKAKKANPELKFYDDQKKVDVLRYCVEAGPFDMSSFLKKYGAKGQDSGWKWAKVVSTKSKDSQLTLQLICRGGEVPNEVKWAVEDYYKKWKDGSHSPFDGCDYAQARFTMSLCASGGY